MKTNILIKNLINELENLPMSNETESVGTEEDKANMKLEYQWDIFHYNESNVPLDRLCYDYILHEYIRELVFNTINFDIFKDIGLDWAFVRKYESEGRASLSPHFDSDQYTINIMLSEPNDYEGGEFIYCPSKYFNEAFKAHSIEDKLELLKKLTKENRAHVLKPNKGDIIVLMGQHQDKIPPNLHCVYPVTKGVRYVLCLFFDKTSKDLSDKIVNLYYQSNLN